MEFAISSMGNDGILGYAEGGVQMFMKVIKRSGVFFLELAPHRVRLPEVRVATPTGPIYMGYNNGRQWLAALQSDPGYDKGNFKLKGWMRAKDGTWYLVWTCKSCFRMTDRPAFHRQQHIEASWLGKSH